MPLVEISNGELADKWTINQIKIRELTDSLQQKNLEREARSLAKLIEELTRNDQIRILIENLGKVNEDIWFLMEELYVIKDYSDLNYVSLTMRITKLNQERAQIKKEIDLLSGSRLFEAKSYFEDSSKIVRLNEDSL